MSNRNTLAVFLVLPALLAGCASRQVTESEKAPYFDAAYDDKNRAPASISPQVFKLDGENVTIDPLYMRTKADFHFSMGEALSYEGRSKEAIENFKTTLIYDSESSTVHLRLAAEYMRLGMMSEAVTQAEYAADKNPTSVDANLFLGGVYSGMKAYDRAMSHYQKVLKLDPQNLEAPLYIGALYSEQKQYDKAVDYFQRLIKSENYPTPYLAWYYIGRVRSEQKTPAAMKLSLQAFDNSLKQKPDFADAAIAKASVYLQEDDVPKAIATYKQYQVENGPEPRVAEGLAQLYIEREDYESAIEQLKLVDKSGDSSLTVKMKLSLLLIETKKFSDAIALLESILEEAPDSDKVRFYLAAVYEETGKYELALSNFKKIQDNSQFYSEAMVHAAYLQKGFGKIDDAVELLSEAIKKKQDNPQLYAMLASLLDDKGLVENALTTLEKGIEIHPDHAQLRFYYGTMSDKVGRKDVVISEMKKVLELEPEHVQGLNYLAFTLAEMDANLQDAEALAKRALSLEPQDGYILDTLGWIYYKQGKYADAVKALEAAHRAQPEVSIIAEHLGDAYMKKSLAEKAMRMYEKAVALETDNIKIQELRKKITAIERQNLDTAQRTPASAP